MHMKHMNNNLFFAVYAATACLTTYSAQAQDLEVGYENKPFDSPEGWAMAHTLASAINLGSAPAEDLGLWKWRLEGEVASIPHLSEAQQKVGFGGFKQEDLNKSPVFGRAKLNVGLPGAFTAQLSWSPSINIGGAKPSGLFGAAIERALFTSGRWQLGGRLHAVRGSAIADVTCSKRTVSFSPGSAENPFSCAAPSKDRIRMNQQGVEIMLSRSINDDRWHPFVALAHTRFNPFIGVEAALFDIIHEWELESSGSVSTYSVGASFAATPKWRASTAFSYTPLRVRRPPLSLTESDDFWTLRLSLSYRGS